MPRNKKNNRNKSNQHSPMPHSSNVKKRPSIPPPPTLPPPPPPTSINDVSALRPTDREALFARLDSAIESAAEEDAGRIPKNLLIGPDLKVESAGKKRRIIPTPGAGSVLSHHTLITTGSKTSAETAPVPVLSSPSSVSISMDSFNNSHIIDKSFSKHTAHIAPPTRGSHGILEDVPSSVQSNPSSSLLLNQLHSAYPNTRSKHRQPPSSILSPEAPLMELSTVSTGTIQKKATTGQHSLSPPHEQTFSPKLAPLSPPGSVVQIEQCNDDALVISPAHTSQPLTSRLDDVGSIDRSSNEPIVTTISPSITSAAITIGNDGPRQQSVSSAEKHRTSLDEPAGSNRPTKKRDESTNKDMGKPESKSTATGHHSSASHSSGSSSSPPPAPTSPTRAGGRNKKEKPVFTTVASRIGSRRKQRAPKGSSTMLPSAPTVSSTKVTKSTTKPTATSSALISRSVIEIDDDSGCDDNERMMIIDDHPASTATSESSDSKMLSTGSSTSSSHSERANSSIPNIPPTTSTTSAGKVISPPVRLYVIPAFMDRLVYSLSRDRALHLKWEWLGPLEKTLSTDPRGNQDALPLDQERTTHIVTAFSDMDKVKKFFHVETINPKIEVVNNLWLTDAILVRL
ncbi:MAG: hypothetical protein J3R72DRAFT_456662 [Linnemannia gamsii]|nr:MAG: hypothetical protein J3R72DRAFT_456662 [Linnemannia gamsii]